jgi:hypothetical protein
MQTRKATNEELVSIVENSNGKMLNLKTVKDNGEFRSLTGRLGVRKGTNGNGLKFNPAEKGLIVIWDKDKQEHRMVRKENIYEVSLCFRSLLSILNTCYKSLYMIYHISIFFLI